MFIVLVNYKVNLEVIDKLLPEHIEYLKENYKKENFIISGRRTPRTGGIIMSDLPDRTELEKILAEDPFSKNNAADYEIIDLTVSMTSEKLNFLKKN